MNEMTMWAEKRSCFYSTPEKMFLLAHVVRAEHLFRYANQNSLYIYGPSQRQYTRTLPKTIHKMLKCLFELFGLNLSVIINE